MDSIFIQIGTPFFGQVSTDPAGRRKVEGNISTQRWLEASSVAQSLSTVISKTCQCKADSLKIVEVLLETGKDELSAALEIQFREATTSLSHDKALAVTTSFAKGLVGDPQIDLNAIDHIDDETHTLLKSELASFKAEHPVRRLNHALVVKQGPTTLAILKGSLIGSKSQKQPAQVRHTIEALYDGRQLRARKVFLVLTKAQGKVLELSYDEARFDQALRELNDNKHAVLSVSYLEVIEASGKEYLQLDTLKVIKDHPITTPEAFELC